MRAARRWLPLLLTLAMSTALAIPHTYLREYTYQATPLDTRESARTIALNGVRTDLLAEIGTHVRSVIRSSRDERGIGREEQHLTALTAGVVSMEILEERWQKPDFYVRARLVADPDEVLEAVRRISAEEGLREMLLASEAARREAEREIEQLRQQLVALAPSMPVAVVTSPAFPEPASATPAAPPPAPVIAAAPPAEPDPKPAPATAPASAVVAIAPDTLREDYRAAAGRIADEDGMQVAIATYRRGDLALALQMLERLAQRGHRRATYALGRFHLLGIGTRRDPDRARELLERAAAAGVADAIATLGWMHERGEGFARDTEAGRKLYREAAARGSDYGKSRLAMMMFVGRRGSGNRPEAVRLFREAAEAGDSLALAMMGVAHERGMVVEKDLGEAFRYFTESARLGNGLAIYRLARFYDEGIEVGRNPERARQLREDARRRGFDPARMQPDR